MTRLVLLSAILLLTPTIALAKDVYNIRPLTEAELLSTYENLLRDACHFSDREWHDWSVDKTAGYWGDGVSTGNEGIRGISNLVFTSGVLLKYCPDLPAPEREHLLNKATAAIRYIVATHKTGPQKCVDGKQWGAGGNLLIGPAPPRSVRGSSGINCRPSCNKAWNASSPPRPTASSIQNRRPSSNSILKQKKTVGTSSASPPRPTCSQNIDTPPLGTRKPSSTCSTPSRSPAI